MKFRRIYVHVQINYSETRAGECVCLCLCGMPAKMKAGARVVWRLTVGCRDRRGVVIEVMETILHGHMTFSYVIALDPVVASSSQLISKYGNPIKENTKVLYSEDEMWRDDRNRTTNVYLQGSVLEMYESAHAHGKSCFYGIQLDSVRAVDGMVRLEHRIDLYSDAYNLQVMLWQNTPTALAAEGVVVLHETSVADRHGDSALSYTCEHYSSLCPTSATLSPRPTSGTLSPRATPAALSPWGSECSNDLKQPDTAQMPCISGAIPRSDMFGTSTPCSILGLDQHMKKVHETIENQHKPHESTCFFGGDARKLRWRRELRQNADGVASPRSS